MEAKTKKADTLESKMGSHRLKLTYQMEAGGDLIEDSLSAQKRLIRKRRIGQRSVRDKFITLRRVIYVVYEKLITLSYLIVN